MAYTKQTWECGETITADKLNHMEDGIAEASGGGTAGYECEEETVTLTEESVTTTAQGNLNQGGLSYSQFIDADSITVTFDGVEYECPRTEEDNIYYYGAPWNGSTQAYDWSEYPFVIWSSASLGNFIATETVGTYSVKIEIEEETITTTPCFEKAVQSCTETARITAEVIYSYGTVISASVSASDAWSALEQGGEVRVKLAGNTGDDIYDMCYLASSVTNYRYDDNAPIGHRITFACPIANLAVEGETVQDIHVGNSRVDIFCLPDTGQCWWVFANYWQGRHE